MEEKRQSLAHGKPLGDDEQSALERYAYSPDQPVTRSPDQPSCSPDLLAPSPDCNNCRECLAAIAHRLAQPMTALRGGIELGLMGKRSSADFRSVLEELLQVADNMAQMISSLRDLGESGAPGGAPQCVPLEATVIEIVAEMDALAQSREIRLQVKVDGTPKVTMNSQRLREALQCLFAWVIQNSAGGDLIAVELSAAEGEVRMLLSLPRTDLQYLQIKALDDITNPGMLFSHAAKNGALGWAINQRLIAGLGGKLEILTGGPEAGCLCVHLPLAPE